MIMTQKQRDILIFLYFIHLQFKIIGINKILLLTLEYIFTIFYNSSKEVFLDCTESSSIECQIVYSKEYFPYFFAT